MVIIPSGPSMPYVPVADEQDDKPYYIFFVMRSGGVVRMLGTGRLARYVISLRVNRAGGMFVSTDGLQLVDLDQVVGVSTERIMPPTVEEGEEWKEGGECECDE